MNKQLSLLMTFAGVLCALALFSFAPSCSPADTGCNSDVDCPGAKCQLATGLCVECLGPEDCADDGGFCCQGRCLEDTERENNCGCSPDPSGVSGDTCTGETPVCQLNGERVSLDVVDEGVCGCPCDASLGGTLCELSDVAEEGFVCGCDNTNPVATCAAPAIDENSIPHVAADTCSPQGVCACFGDSDNNICVGGTPDCTTDGCVNLVSSVDNCGTPGRLCSDEDSGIGLEGVCVSGGCECNQNSDCQGEGLNVDSCAFVGNTEQQACVCDGYEVAGDDAACPMGLPCVEGGCEYESVAYATDELLLNAVRGIESEESASTLAQ